MSRPIPHRADQGPEGRGPDAAETLADELLARLGAERGASEPPGESYRRLLREALSAAAEARGELLQERREAERLRRLTVTDAQTGVLNRRGFEQALERALARLQRTGETGLLLVVDLDNFKQINDAHGHAAGDLALAAVASLLSRHTRATDAVARLGGDEFAVVLGGTDETAGRLKAARLEALLNALTLTWRGATIALSASVGAVSYGGEDLADEVVHRADLDMYQKKRLTAAASREAANAEPAAAARRDAILLDAPARG
ncbi:MAG: GGDEF domain-containing protein [Marivibrio sp.]|uniref:GGDEF domain-containing protein n=1 Tax=Marivibrio sp. TaxID=2039719 RepID=UPI0032ED28DC